MRGVVAEIACDLHGRYGFAGMPATVRCGGFAFGLLRVHGLHAARINDWRSGGRQPGSVPTVLRIPNNCRMPSSPRDCSQVLQLDADISFCGNINFACFVGSFSFNPSSSASMRGRGGGIEASMFAIVPDAFLL